MSEKNKIDYNKSKAATRILDTAKDLFYREGIQCVGIDRIVKEANVAINTMYKYFPSKDALVEAYLIDRDKLWMKWLEDFVNEEQDLKKRLLTIFDAMDSWFNKEIYRGCAFINAYGEIGTVKSYIHDISKDHKDNLYKFILKLAEEAKVNNYEQIAKEVLILVEGAIVVASISEDKNSAKTAKLIAEKMINQV